MFLPPSLQREIEQITDREMRHKARSLFACYLGYLELRHDSPRYESRLAALQRALSDLGITASPETVNERGDRLIAH